MIKKMLAFTIALTFNVILSGCTKTFLPMRTEIDKLMMIRAVGIDKGFTEPDNICVTIISKKVGDTKNGGGQAGKEAAVILSNEAKTVLEAEREFQTYSDKQMFWGHVDFYLISEEAAKEGIAKYLDFLSRDHEMRGNSKVYIIKGSTAKEFIKKSSTGEYFMPDRLKAIGENAKLITGSQELELLEFMQWLNNKYSAAVAPVLYLKAGKDDKEEGGGSPGMDIELDMYAIFKNLKLVTFINKSQTRGENFLLNRVVTGVIQVKEPAGTMIGLDIIDSHTKITTVFNKGELQGMLVKVKLITNVDEVHSTRKLFTKDTLKFLSKEQSNVIKSEIEQVIKTAQENNADFVDMANVFGTRHPVLWEKYKDRWDDIFPKLPVKVDVESIISRTYDIREPNGFYGEEHK